MEEFIRLTEELSKALDTGDLITGLGIITTGAIRTIAPLQSKKARSIAESGNKLAEKANLLSEKANNIAREANEFAAKANRLGEKANEIAEEANRIARDANSLAAEANSLAKNRGLRETERHDVQWHGDWEGAGIYVLINRGRDTAHKVVASVTYDGEFIRTSEVDQAPLGTKLTFDFPEAREKLEEERRKRQEERKNLEFAPFYNPAMTIYYPPFASIEEHVTRESRLGVPHAHDEFSNFAGFGEEI